MREAEEKRGRAEDEPGDRDEFGRVRAEEEDAGTSPGTRGDKASAFEERQDVERAMFLSGLRA